MDIDTDLSEISEIIEEVRDVKDKKRVHIQSPDRSLNKTPSRSPSKAHYEVVYHEVILFCFLFIRAAGKGCV